MTPGLVLGLCRNVYCRRSWILLLLVFNHFSAFVALANLRYINALNNNNNNNQVFFIT